MAMVNARFRFRYGGLAGGFPWPPGVRSLLQQLFGDLRFAGPMIILLTWFYLSGLMLLIGGEINSEIEAAVHEKKLAAAGEGSGPRSSPLRLLELLASITLRIKRFPSCLHLTGRWRGMSCSWDI